MGWPGEVNDTNSNKGRQAGNDTNAEGAYHKFLAQAIEQPSLTGDGGGFEDTDAQTDTSSQASTSEQNSVQPTSSSDDNGAEGKRDVQTVNSEKKELENSQIGKYELEDGIYKAKAIVSKPILSEKRPDSVSNRSLENWWWGVAGGVTATLFKKGFEWTGVLSDKLDHKKKVATNYYDQQKTNRVNAEKGKQLLSESVAAKQKAAANYYDALGGDSALRKDMYNQYRAVKANVTSTINALKTDFHNDVAKRKEIYGEYQAAKKDIKHMFIPDFESWKNQFKATFEKKLEDKLNKPEQPDKLDQAADVAKKAQQAEGAFEKFVYNVRKSWHTPGALTGTVCESAWKTVKNTLNSGGIIRGGLMGAKFSSIDQLASDFIMVNSPEKVQEHGCYRLPDQPHNYVWGIGIPSTILAGSMKGGIINGALTLIGGVVADQIIKPVDQKELDYNNFYQNRGLAASCVGSAGVGIGFLDPKKLLGGIVKKLGPAFVVPAFNVAKYAIGLPTVSWLAKTAQASITEPLRVHNTDYAKSLTEAEMNPSDSAKAQEAWKKMTEFSLKGGTGAMEVIERLANRKSYDPRSSAITHVAAADAQFELGSRVKRNESPKNPTLPFVPDFLKPVVNPALAFGERAKEMLWHSYTGDYKNHSEDVMLIGDPNNPDLRLDFNASATIDYMIAKNDVVTTRALAGNLSQDMENHIDKRLNILLDGSGISQDDAFKLMVLGYDKITLLTRAKNMPEALRQMTGNERLIKGLLNEDLELREKEVEAWVRNHEKFIGDPDRIALESNGRLTEDDLVKVRTAAILKAHDSGKDNQGRDKLVAKLCRDRALLCMAAAKNALGPNNEYAADKPLAGSYLRSDNGVAKMLSMANRLDPECAYNKQLMQFARELGVKDSEMTGPPGPVPNFGPSSIGGVHYGDIPAATVTMLGGADKNIRAGKKPYSSAGEVQQPEFSTAPEQDWNANARRRQEAEEQNSNIRRYEPKPQETEDERRRREAEEYDRNMLNTWQNQNSGDGFMKQNQSQACQDPGFEQ